MGVFVGGGRTCAPRIGTLPSDTSPPTPKCKVGGAAAQHNGCPKDAPVIVHSKAWPVCLGIGNGTDPYSNGDFHCLLVCPCHEGPLSGGKCGAGSHLHCPTGAWCVRGETRKRDQGVCTYLFREAADGEYHSQTNELLV